MNTPKDEDRDWYNALSGTNQKQEDTPATREGQALRNAILAEDKRAKSRPAPAANLQGLLDRLETEELLEPRIRRNRHQRWYALAASLALAAFAAPIVIQLVTEQQPPGIETPRGLLEPQIIKVGDPESESLELFESLSRQDLAVERYFFDGSWILDFQVAVPVTPPVRAALDEYDVTVPPDGRVILAFPQD